MRILVVGLTNIDIINLCEEYPNEDEDVHVTSQHWSKGGNAANTSSVLAQYKDIQVDLLSCLSSKIECSFVQHQLEKFGINLKLCPVFDLLLPVSTCILNKQNGSRTILHSRNNFPELSEKHFSQVHLTNYDWIHFEGRNLEVVHNLINQIRNFRGSKTLPMISGEMEKVKRISKLEKYLLPNVDVLFVGKDIARAKSFSSSEETVTKLSEIPDIAAKYIFSTWGEEGASLSVKSENTETFMVYSCKPKTDNRIVDTLGAGDTFIAGAIRACLKAYAGPDILKCACDLATRKCCQHGFKNLCH